MRANKAVILFALATLLFCLLSFSLKYSVLAGTWQTTVNKFAHYGENASEAEAGLGESEALATDFENAMKERLKGSKAKKAAAVEGEQQKDKPTSSKTEIKDKDKDKGKDKGKQSKGKGGAGSTKTPSKSTPAKDEKGEAVSESKPEPSPSTASPVSKDKEKDQAAQKEKQAAKLAKKEAEVKKNKAAVLDKLSKVKAAPKQAKKEGLEGKLRTAKGKIIHIMAPYGTEHERITYKCGKMPESMWPKFTEQKIKKGGSRRYIAKTGYVSPMNVHKKVTRAKTENGPRRGRIERSTGRLKKGEQPLVKCLNNLGKCDNSSMQAARVLDGMGTLLSTKNTMIKKTYNSCALVGNSGAMKEKKYGQYIDTHDFVARVNALPTRRFEQNLGNKTSLRVMSFKISKDVCCFKKDYKPDNKQLQFLIWFPASRSDILKQLRKRYPTNPSSVMPTPFLSTAVNVFKQLRKDLLRLGYGPFEEWEYMTSGMHALLGLVQSCHVVNLYGFTTDVSTKGPYWFTGRRQPPRSGRTQHAWDHERMVLRSLYAAGLINICTP